MDAKTKVQELQLYNKGINVCIMFWMNKNIQRLI